MKLRELSRTFVRKTYDLLASTDLKKQLSQDDYKGETP